MAAEWIPRLKGHAELVQRLVEEVPKALDRPSLTLISDPFAHGY